MEKSQPEEKSKNREVRLFGFKINNTASVILFFLALGWILTSIKPLIIFFQSLTQLIGLSLSELGGYTFTLLIINPLIFLILLMIYIYILIVCTRTKKLYREIEDAQIQWFGFTLTQSSYLIISLLSILNIIMGIYSLFTSISSFIFLYNTYPLSPLPIYNIILFIIDLVVSLTLMLIYIYTIIIGKMAKVNLDI